MFTAATHVEYSEGVSEAGKTLYVQFLGERLCIRFVKTEDPNSDWRWKPGRAYSGDSGKNFEGFQFETADHLHWAVVWISLPGPGSFYIAEELDPGVVTAVPLNL